MILIDAAAGMAFEACSYGWYQLKDGLQKRVLHE